MYVIEGRTSITPKQFLMEKTKQVKRFFQNNRDTKIKMVLVCILELKKTGEETNLYYPRQRIFSF